MHLVRALPVCCTGLSCMLDEILLLAVRVMAVCCTSLACMLLGSFLHAVRVFPASVAVHVCTRGHELTKQSLTQAIMIVARRIHSNADSCPADCDVLIPVSHACCACCACCHLLTLPNLVQAMMADTRYTEVWRRAQRTTYVLASCLVALLARFLLPLVKLAI